MPTTGQSHTSGFLGFLAIFCKTRTAFKNTPREISVFHGREQKSAPKGETFDVPGAQFLATSVISFSSLEYDSEDEDDTWPKPFYRRPDCSKGYILG